MHDVLTDLVIRYRKLLLGFWLVLTIGAIGIVTGGVNSFSFLPTHVPGWHQVAADGESVRLPASVPTTRGELLFNQAFPAERLGSKAVVILYREKSPLTSLDRAFIEDEVTPRLIEIQAEPGTTIRRVRDFNDRGIGKILVNRAGDATLIVVDLQHDFLDQRNKLSVDRIQQLIESDRGPLSSTVPAGLKIALGGAATVGRDLVRAARDDARTLNEWPILVIIGLSLAIFRGPLVALMPALVTYVSLQISLAGLILLAWAGSSGIEPLTVLRPFAGLQTFVCILVYGAGLNYSIFFIARYRREIDRGATVDHALAAALRNSGTTVIASVGTIFCGIGTMLNASFGKYQQVGGAIVLALGIALVCSLTLLPALLRMTGKYAFWLSAARGDASNLNSALSAGVRHHVDPSPVADRGWAMLNRHPFLIWSTIVAVMLPFAVTGVVLHGQTIYGVVGDLPPNSTGVVGALAIEKYFGAGECGPVTALLHNRQIDFSSSDSYEMFEPAITKLAEQRQQLDIVDIRSLMDPLGLEIEAGVLVRGIAKRFYISRVPEHEGHVMQFDLLMRDDAFSPDTRRQLQVIGQTLRDSLPELIRAETELFFIGTTAGVMDLKAITDRDQIVLDSGMLAIVFLVLIVIWRKVAVPCYLILSVCFVYCATLGLTAAIFWMLDPGFAGMDWKVPIFLFTIVVALGQDHNVFLISRIKEEQIESGTIGGIRTALASTGSTLSKCGLLTAASFFCLAVSGHLSGSRQLGTALTIGILLDMFVARRILFPAWLLMLKPNRS